MCCHYSKHHRMIVYTVSSLMETTFLEFIRLLLEIYACASSCCLANSLVSTQIQL